MYAQFVTMRRQCIERFSMIFPVQTVYTVCISPILGGVQSLRNFAKKSKIVCAGCVHSLFRYVQTLYIVCTYRVFTKIQRLCIFSKNQKYIVPAHCENSVDSVFDSVFETMYRLCLGRTEFVHSLWRQKYRVHTESFKIFYMFHLVANTTMFTRMIHEIFEHQIRQRSISS